MGRPPKLRAEEEVEEGNFGCEDVVLFEKVISDQLKGEVLDEICVPKGYGTGSFKLDMGLTVAIPQGSIVELFAENGVGKTTVALEIEGQAQQNGCRVAYLDLEGSLNMSLVQSIRTLDINKKDKDGQPLWMYKEGLIKDKETGETKVMNGDDAFKYIISFASFFKNAYLVVDSVDSIIPAAIEAKEVGESTMGQLARLMSDGMRRLHGVCKKNKTTVIFINQVRASLNMYGNPVATPGGNALKFYAWQRIELKKGSKADLLVNEEGKIIGHKLKAKIIKNKVMTSNDEVEFYILYGKGIYREMELIELGIMYGLIPPWEDAPKRFFNIEGEKVSQSKAAEWLLVNPTKCKELEDKIMKVVHGT